MRLDESKDTQSLKPAWSTLHSELKFYIVTPLEGNDKGYNMNTQTHTSG